MEDDRKKALAAALSQIDKQFGKGTVMRLGEAPASWDVETVSTGSLGLDIALGVGGLPRARVIEVFGPESSGKTTLAYALARSTDCVFSRIQSLFVSRLLNGSGGEVLKIGI